MREIRFEVDGESVAGSLHEPTAAPRGQIVLVHGFLSQRTEFADAPARLAERGWRVLAVDQRGFGASGGQRGVFDQDRSTADTIAAVDWLRASSNAPVGLVAHSMGAVFGVNALAKDTDLKAAVLAAPMKSVRAELKDAEFLGYRVANGISRAKSKLGLGPLVVPYKNRYVDLFRDPEAAKRATEAGFLASSVSLANYDALLAMDSTRVAPRVKQPTLVILAQYDKAVQHKNSREVYDALGGPKEIVTLPCGHSMFGDCESAAAIDHVDRWFEKHLA